MSRVYNFSAGPGMLPVEVLEEAAAEMLDYKGTGESVMEMSHRSKEYGEIIQTAEADFRELLGLPDNYKVLFLQGGASTQFAMIPMNFMKNKKAAYIVTGQRIRHSHIFLIVQILIFLKMQTMFTSVRTTQFMVQSSRSFLTQRAIT